MATFTAPEIEVYHLLNIPPDLLDAIRADSLRNDRSLNDIVNEVMAARYGFSWVSSERHNRPSSRDFIFCRLPATVLEAVRAESWVKQVTMRSIFLAALSEHYDHQPPKAARTTGSGRPRAKPPRGRKGNT